jgi:2-keto-4-pentenoate hydratase/2-oxohepta-3-ene-1,7-dioic acid hydratase in catechol pathway
MTYSLVTYRSGAETRLGVRPADTGVVLAPPELKQWATMLDLLEDWPRAAEILADLTLAGQPTVADAELHAPVAARKVLCAGVNYRRHLAEMGGEVPGAGWAPYFFLKPPSTAVIGPVSDIVIRDAQQARYDWEAELAVITARGYHRRSDVPAEPFAYDWFAAKALDTSMPMGPGITPAFLVANPQELQIRLWVNDVLQQDESTADMICPVSELIAAASRIVTLEPGDVISTGTPSGVGAGRGLQLAHGDRIRVAIDGLGEITNHVTDTDQSRP